MKESVLKIHKATDGKKTVGVSLLMSAFQIAMLIAPNLLDSNTEKIVTFAISSGFIPTLLHKAYKNREVIKGQVIKPFLWIANKFKKE